MKWRPIDFIVLTVIILIAVALTLFMLRPYLLNTPNPPETLAMVHDLFAALIAIVAVYVGSSIDRFINVKNEDSQK